MNRLLKIFLYCSLIWVKVSAQSTITHSGSRVYHFDDSKVYLGANDFVWGSGYSSLQAHALQVSGGTGYFVTNGTGLIKYYLKNQGSAVNAHEKTQRFLVGNSSINAVTITNNSDNASTYSIRVDDLIKSQGVTGTLITTDAVSRTWSISADVANSGSGIDLTLEWDDAQELSGLANPMIHWYDADAGTWKIVPTGTHGILTENGTNNSLTLSNYSGTLSGTQYFSVQSTESPTAADVTATAFPKGTIQFNLSATDPNYSSGSLVYQAQVLPTNGFFYVEGDKGYYETREVPTGTYTFTYVAVNPDGLQGEATISVEVIPFEVNSSPGPNDRGIDVNAELTLLFTRALAHEPSADYVVVQGAQSGLISGTWASVSSSSYSFTPSQPYKYGEKISVSVRQELGLRRPYVFTFETAAHPHSLATFSEEQTIGNLTSLDEIRLLDIDRNGYLDVLGSGVGVHWLQNDGLGQFTSNEVASSSYLVRSTATVDSDLDGYIDMLIPTVLNDKLDLFINDGSQQFTIDNIIPTTDRTYDEIQNFVVGDIDGDGYLNGVGVAGIYGKVFSVQRSKRTGEYSPLILASEVGYSLSVLGDIDQDYDLDLLVYDSNANTIVVNKVQIIPSSNPSSNNDLVLASSTLSIPFVVRDIKLVDVTGNGYLDLVITGSNIIFFQNINGSFTSGYQVIEPTNSIYPSMDIGDVDADGDLDIIALDYQNDLVIQYTNLGNSFEKTTILSGIPAPIAIALGDLDGDGDLDIVTAPDNSPSHEVFWLENKDLVAPVVSDQSFEVAERTDAGAAIAMVEASDDVGIQSYAIVSGNTDGYFEINNTGRIALTPAGEATTAPTFDYETLPNQFVLGVAVSDRDNSTTVSVTINITDVNEAPVAQNITFQTTGSSVATFTLLATDVDDTELVYRPMVLPNMGSFTVSGTTGIFETRGVPAGTYTMTYLVIDPDELTDEAEIEVTVLATAPTVISPVPVNPIEDIPFEYDLNQVAFDPNGGTLTFDIAVAPTIGTATISGSILTYLTTSETVTRSTMDYTATNATGTSTGTIDFWIILVNDPPVAQDLSVHAPRTGTISFTLLATDPEGGDIVYQPDILPTVGSFTISGTTGYFETRSVPNGTYTMTYEARDSGNLAGTGTVTVTVAAQTPEVSDISINATGTGTVTFTLLGVDPDGDDALLVYQPYALPSVGSFTVSGTVGYFETQLVPAGTYTMTYQAIDGDMNIGTGTITATVVPGVPRVIQDMLYNTDADQRVSVNLTALAYDPNGGDLNYSIVQDPDYGSAVLSGTYLVYSGAATSTVVDSLVFAASNGSGTISVTMYIRIPPSIPYPPVAQNVSAEVIGTGVVTFTLSATDPDGANSALVYQAMTQPLEGSFTVSGTTGIYETRGVPVGTYTMTYLVIDEDELTAEGIITIEVIGSLPAYRDQMLIDGIDQEQVLVDLTELSMDLNGGDLAYSIVTAPVQGTAVLSGTTVVYTPDDGDLSVDSFVFSATNQVGTVTATVYIQVRIPENQPPVAQDITVTAPRTGTVTFTLSATDPEGGTVTYNARILPRDGAFLVMGDTGIYETRNVPVGTYTMTYEARDEQGNFGEGTITVSVVTYPPVAQSVSAEVIGTGTVTFTLTATDSDGDDEDLVYQPMILPPDGSFTVSGTTGIYETRGVPVGTYTMTYVAIDVDGNIGEGLISVDVLASQPAFVDQTLVDGIDLDEVLVDLTNITTDLNGGTLTYTIITEPEQGTAVLSGTSVVYTPAEGDLLVDSFVFGATNASGTVTATVYIQLRTPSNRTPVAQNISVTVVENTPEEIALSGTDPDGDALVYSLVVSPTVGTAVLSDTSIVYTSTSDTALADTMVYQVSDGSLTATATISVAIQGVNDAPTAQNISVTAVENTPKEIALSGTDPDGDALVYSLVVSPTVGTAVLSGTTIVYTSTSDTAVEDTMVYQVSDGSLTATATISVAIQGVNDAPSAQNISVTAVENTPVEIGLSGTDPDGDALVYSLVVSPTAGTAVLSGTTLVYTSTSDTAVADAMVYQVIDGSLTATGTISVVIEGVNDAPVWGELAGIAVPENTEVGEVLATFSATDPDGDALTYSLVGEAYQFSITDNNLVLVAGLDYEQRTGFALSIGASDGTVTSTTDFSVSVTDVEAPAFDRALRVQVYPTVQTTSSQGQRTAKYPTRVVKTVDGGAVILELVPSHDADLMTIHPVTGQWSFMEPPSYTQPLDENLDAVYEVVLRMRNADDRSDLVPVLISPASVLLAEGSLDIGIIEVMLVSAQSDTDWDGVLDTVDNCPLTPNADQADSNQNGIGDVCEDRDGDGLMDAVDQCPDSTPGAVMDVFGCELFVLPASNYRVSVASASCPGENNGSLSLETMNTTYNYTAVVTGPNGTNEFSLNQDMGYVKQITGLASGTYQVCFSVLNKSGYSQCFEVKVTEPAPLNASAVVDYTAKKAVIYIQGARTYTVEVNGSTFRAEAGMVEVDLTSGNNQLRITTDLFCQGEWNQEVFVSEQVLVYPNPSTGPTQIYVGGLDTEVQASLFSVSGAYLGSWNLTIAPNRVAFVDLSAQPDGIYVLRIEGLHTRQELKVIKKQ